MAQLFFMEVIKFTHSELIIKVGKTEEECARRAPLILPINIDSSKPLDLYSTLSPLRASIEAHLMSQHKSKTMLYRFPDGQLPITRL